VRAGRGTPVGGRIWADHGASSLPRGRMGFCSVEVKRLTTGEHEGA